MANIGDAKLLLDQAQNVELLVASDPGATGTLDDTLLLMRQLRIEKNHPETRTDHGRTRTYNYSAPDLGLTFTVSASGDVIPYLNTRNTMNTLNVLPEYKWGMKLTANNGSAIVMNVTGTLPYADTAKNDGPQADPVDISCRIRITDDNITLTTVPAS